MATAGRNLQLYPAAAVALAVEQHKQASRFIHTFIISVLCICQWHPQALWSPILEKHLAGLTGDLLQKVLTEVCGNSAAHYSRQHAVHQCALPAPTALPHPPTASRAHAQLGIGLQQLIRACPCCCACWGTYCAHNSGTQPISLLMADTCKWVNGLCAGAGEELTESALEVS